MTRRRLIELEPVDLDDTARLLTIGDVAERIRMSTRTVRRLIQDGELRAVTQGTEQGIMFVRLPDLQLTSMTLTASTPPPRSLPPG